MKNIYIPISKVDPVKHMVYGYASTDALDSQGEVVKVDALKEALPDYMKYANIREMHRNSAVGKTKEATIDSKGLFIGVKVVDKPAWEKVAEKVYNGFSIGGRVLTKIGDEITQLRLSEISLVDRPANPECEFSVVKFDDGKEGMKVKKDIGGALEALEIAADAEQMAVGEHLNGEDTTNLDTAVNALKEQAQSELGEPEAHEDLVAHMQDEAADDAAADIMGDDEDDDDKAERPEMIKVHASTNTATTVAASTAATTARDEQKVEFDKTTDITTGNVIITSTDNQEVDAGCAVVPQNKKGAKAEEIGNLSKYAKGTKKCDQCGGTGMYNQGKCTKCMGKGILAPAGVVDDKAEEAEAIDGKDKPVDQTEAETKEIPAASKAVEDEAEKVEKATLSTSQRNNLDDSDFAYIDSKGGRHLPINDAAHVRNALARFNQTQFESQAAKDKALAAINAAAKKFGVNTSNKRFAMPTEDEIKAALEKAEIKVNKATLGAAKEALANDMLKKIADERDEQEKIDEEIDKIEKSQPDVPEDVASQAPQGPVLEPFVHYMVTKNEPVAPEAPVVPAPAEAPAETPVAPVVPQPVAAPAEPVVPETPEVPLTPDAAALEAEQAAQTPVEVPAEAPVAPVEEAKVESGGTLNKLEDLNKVEMAMHQSEEALAKVSSLESEIAEFRKMLVPSQAKASYLVEKFETAEPESELLNKIEKASKELKADPTNPAKKAEAEALQKQYMSRSRG